MTQRTENEVLKETEKIKLEEDPISTMVVEIFAHWIVIMIGQINLWIGRLIKFLEDYTNPWQWVKKMRGEKEEDTIGIILMVLRLVILLLIIGTTRVQGKIGTCPKKILRIQIFKTQTSFICPWWTTLDCKLQPQSRVEFFCFFLGGPAQSFQAPKLGWARPVSASLQAVKKFIFIFFLNLGLYRI